MGRLTIIVKCVARWVVDTSADWCAQWHNTTITSAKYHCKLTRQTIKDLQGVVLGRVWSQFPQAFCTELPFGKPVSCVFSSQQVLRVAQ